MKRSARGAAEELTDSLDFLIRDSRLLLMNLIASRIAKLGIPPRIWFPLRVLYRNDGITQRELGRLLGYGDAHAGVIVRVMRRQRLVLRRQSHLDRRRKDLFLTPAGRKLAQQALRQTREINARIVQGFSESEARTFKALLSRAHDNLSVL